MRDPADLNQAIDDHSERIENLERQLNPSGRASLTSVDTRLRGAEAQLATVMRTVDKLFREDGAKKAETEQRQPWHTLTAEQAEQRWHDLHAWITELISRNNIGVKEIPDCWYQHAGLVDELDALRWACLALTKPDSNSTDPIIWREMLHRARSRWPAHNPNGCTTIHNPPRPRAPRDETAWHAFLAEDLGNRPPSGDHQ